MKGTVYSWLEGLLRQLRSEVMAAAARGATEGRGCASGAPVAGSGSGPAAEHTDSPEHEGKGMPYSGGAGRAAEGLCCAPAGMHVTSAAPQPFG